MHVHTLYVIGCTNIFNEKKITKLTIRVCVCVRGKERWGVGVHENTRSKIKLQKRIEVKTNGNMMALLTLRLCNSAFSSWQTFYKKKLEEFDFGSAQ